MRTPALRLCVALIAIVAASCAAERPLVERFDGEAWHAESFRVASLGGQRGGATVPFVLRLEADGGRRLVVEGTVEIDPAATLISSRWFEEGGRAVAGEVSSTALDFFGGQGGRPSLGGQLTLSRDGAAVYRINLPATELGRDR
jgi:hypothetical protein